ncbi:MAG: PspC domain-containing protein [Pseudohongiellaceae bacterium]
MNTGTSRLKLNRRDGRWLGVCAGIAQWLDVPTVLVRVIFVICVISWPTLIIAYFLLYFCLDKDITPDKMRNYFRSASTAEHFKQLNYRKPIYRNERNKRIAGVCSGIADYFEVSAFAVRAVTLLSLFIFGPFTFWAYIICIFVFEPDPHVDPASRSERREQRRQRRAERRAKRKQRSGHASDDYSQFAEEVADEAYAEVTTAFEDAKQQFKKEFDEEVRKSKNRSEGSAYLHSRDRCTDIYNTMELRLREIEAFMTSKRFRLHCEINRI